METLGIEEKHRLIQEWLVSVFGGEEVPEYEITHNTVENLWQLSSICKEKERRMEAIIEDMKQKSQEYAAETERLQSVMNWVGITSSDLSSSAQKSIQNIAGCAVALGTKDCSDTSLCLSLTDLSERQATLTVREREIESECSKREEELRHSVLTQATQKQSLTELSQRLGSEAESVNHKKKSAEFLAKKSTQYQKHITSIKSELQGAGYNDSLSHDALLQTSKEIEDLQSQLEPLKTQLASYQGLPPDLELAKVKVEGAKRELVRLDVELSRCLDLLHTEK